jgi:hypothetical protein
MGRNIRARKTVRRKLTQQAKKHPVIRTAIELVIGFGIGIGFLYAVYLLLSLIEVAQ